MAIVTGYCTKCYGTGQIRKRDPIGLVRPAPCKRCKGIGRKYMQEGSGEHRISQGIITGQSPGIRKGHSKYDSADGSHGYGRR